MIKFIIFDLDGTLVNAYPAVASSVNHTLSVLKFPARSHDQIKRSVGGGDRHLMAQFVGENLADQAMRIYRPHHARALQLKGGVKFLPGALSILKYLKAQGYGLGIASNRPTRFTRQILKTLEALDFFDIVLCADKALRPKPYPDMLEMIARKQKFLIAECLFVGDMTIDVETAHTAGMKVVAVNTGSSSMKELKDLKPWRIIGKMMLLKSIINKGLS